MPAEPSSTHPFIKDTWAIHRDAFHADWAPMAAWTTVVVSERTREILHVRLSDGVPRPAEIVETILNVVRRYGRPGAVRLPPDVVDDRHIIRSAMQRLEITCIVARREHGSGDSDPWLRGVRQEPQGRRKEDGESARPGSQRGGASLAGLPAWLAGARSGAKPSVAWVRKSGVRHRGRAYCAVWMSSVPVGQKVLVFDDPTDPDLIHVTSSKGEYIGACEAVEWRPWQPVPRRRVGRPRERLRELRDPESTS